MIKVRANASGIVLSCVEPLKLPPKLKDGYLEYKDENSGEYECMNEGTDPHIIYVKFRSESRAADGLGFIWSQYTYRMCVCVCVCRL